MKIQTFPRPIEMNSLNSTIHRLTSMLWVSRSKDKSLRNKSSSIKQLKSIWLVSRLSKQTMERPTECMLNLPMRLMEPNSERSTSYIQTYLKATTWTYKDNRILWISYPIRLQTIIYSWESKTWWNPWVSRRLRKKDSDPTVPPVMWTSNPWKRQTIQAALAISWLTPASKA